MMASHGFVVIASSAGNVQDGGTSANQFRNKMVEVAEWVVKQNSTSSSVLYQKIDTAKIGAAGHSQGGYGASEAGQNPLIRTSVSISGAVGSNNQKGPAFIICGGKDTYSGARCEDHPTASYNGTSNVPVFMGKCLSADHGNWGFEAMLSDKTKPSDVVQATIAWFRFHLMGDAAYRPWFYGADCTLCKHSNWSVQRKGME
jgi:dienelactone hydrolase